MRFPSNRFGRKVTGAVAIAVLAIGGCNGDNDPKGFFDPTATGRWQSTALVVPILDKLDIGVEQPDDQFAQASDITPEDLVPNDKDYRISPNDLINVTVSDLLGPGVETPRQVRVTESGNITLPSIGEVPAAGKTESELEQSIMQAYRDAKLIENAQVSVEVIESRGKVFSILGAVPHVGQFPILSNNFRVLDALVLAGDTPSGSSMLYVIRPITNNNLPAVAPATQPANPGAAGGNEPSFNVLAPSTAPAENLAPPTPNTEGIEPATQPASGNELTPAPAPATRSTEGNVPGGGTTSEGMVQMADGTTMPANAAPTTRGTMEVQAPVTQPAAESAPMAANTPTTQPVGGEPEGRIVTLEGQSEQIGGVQGNSATTVPSPAPSMAEATTTATTQPSSSFTFNMPPGATQYREIRIPLDELKNGNLKYNIVIKAGDLIEIPGPDQGVYYVGGHVNRPGVYQIIGQKVTLKQAIISAGLFDQLAIPERTEIIRRIGSNQEVFAEVDLDRIFAGIDPDVYIKPNDTINVGTNILAPFIAAVRNGFRITYGFGFIYDKNFNTEAETGRRP